MLYITEDDVIRVLKMSDAVSLVERGLVDRARRLAVDVPRERARTPQGALNILQGAAPLAGVVGYKAYYVTPHGSHSHIYLYDADGGVPLAILEASHFNVVRTGAASGAATRHLARGNAAVVGQIGAGRMGAGQLEAVCAVRPVRSARVYSRTGDKLQAFCRMMSEKLGIEVMPAGSAETAVRGADIVNVITQSSTPVLLGAWIDPGQHVNAAGSNALSRRELDMAAMRRCELIVVDSRETARKECGDILPLVEAGLAYWDALPEIGEIAAGLRPGRTSDGQVTLYESHGMAIQDLYVAAKVIELARAQGLGRKIAG